MISTSGITAKFEVMPDLADELAGMEHRIGAEPYPGKVMKLKVRKTFQKWASQ